MYIAATKEMICEVCGEPFDNEKEGASHSICAKCNDEIDMKVNKMLLERRWSYGSNGRNAWDFAENRKKVR